MDESEARSEETGVSKGEWVGNSRVRIVGNGIRERGVGKGGLEWWGKWGAAGFRVWEKGSRRGEGGKIEVITVE